jgi:serine/threonine-protein kinase
VELKRIGELLIQLGRIDSARLEEGLSAQVIHGARLGTNLVELGLLDIDTLAQALGEQHGVPVAEPRVFEEASRETLAVVPKTVCSRYGIFPLRYESPSKLHLAMVDPHKLEVIDEVGAILAIMEIHPYATPELRLHYQLERHYRVKRPTRFLRPVGKPITEDRRTYLQPTLGETRQAMKDRLVEPEPETEGADFVISFEGFEESEAALPAIESVIESLEKASDRDAVLEVLVQQLLPEVDLTVLFVVRGELAVAEGAWGTKLPPSEVHRLVVPMARSELMAWVAAERSPLRGAPDGDPVQEKIAQFFRTPTPGDVCLAPICLHGNPVNLLCLQTSRSFGDQALADVSRVAVAASSAYERLLGREMAAAKATKTKTEPLRVQRRATPLPVPRAELEDSVSGLQPAEPEPVAEVGSRVAREIRLLPRRQRRFGRYELICRLASGGMANLYLARLSGRAGFAKEVAIKRIHEHLSEEEEFIQMFIDEARLAARITHPNVGQVLEFDKVEDSFYIAMEYVHGESLHALIASSRPKVALTARIIANAAAGLHAAHELCDESGESLGVVHRDVSPQNILISYQGSVKVVDFGVARARGNIHTTNVGTAKGKLAYMSPEQVASRDQDRRSDVFGLGIVLYEATTFQRLFKASSEAATMNRVVHGEITPPTLIREGYPPELEAVVMKALERDPDRRFQTAEELQIALETFIMRSESLVLASALGKLMQATFAKRIAEKKAVKEAFERESDG